MSYRTHNDIFTIIERWAPKSLAYDWDNVGLQVGSRQSKTNNIMVTLDVTDSVVEEAIEQDVNLIIAHHPLLFQSLKNINTDSVKGAIIQKLIANNITVYAAHTNLDIAPGGVNDLLSDALQLEAVDHLVETKREKLVKLVVFVPVDHVQAVQDAMGNAGAGHIGNYSHCAFKSKGEGTFKPLEGTNPYIGTKGEIEYVEEYKLESIVPEENVASVLQAIESAHPYEEVAYDLYPLNNSATSHSLGRIGTLQNHMTLYELCERVKQVYSMPHVRVTGELNRKVNRIAIIGGSGEKFIPQAIAAQADVLITGDVTFHHAQDAKEMGLAIIDAGHYIEKIMKKATKQYISAQLNDNNINVIISKTNTDPFQFI